MKSMKDVLSDIGVQNDEEIQKVKQKPHAVIVEREEVATTPEPDKEEQEQEQDTFDAEVDMDDLDADDMEDMEDIEIIIEDKDYAKQDVFSTVPALMKEWKKDFIDCSFVEYITKEDSVLPWIIAGGIILFGVLIASTIWTA